jgi:GWxTD domain-containing protein
MKIKLIAFLVFLGLLASGCAGKRVGLDPSPDNPIYLQKKEFLDKYFYFVTPPEVEEFKLLTTIEAFNKFDDEFWKKRDTNPLTPENEFKSLVDGRIQDIENEIFATDFDIPGTRFGPNGGLRGDLAHIYLFYGAPGYKAKLFSGRTYVDLVVWYYFDIQGKPLFRFLFYEDYGRVKLFRDHVPIIDMGYLFDPLGSPLRVISNKPVVTQEDLYELWSELEQNDADWAFRSALLEFSYYNDVSVDDALMAPEPVALTAARFKPTILGQPEDLSGREFIKNSYHSFIPAILRIGAGINTGIYTPYILVKFGDLDWEIRGDDRAECFLFLRISFQHKTTKEIREFVTNILLSPNKETLAKNNMTAKEFIEKNKDSYFTIRLNQFSNSIELSPGNLASLVSNLRPGSYVVNTDFRNNVTKKSAGGWREEIVIK